MKLKKIIIALAAALVTSATSYAVTLGDVRVNSYLSQPLDAEIDIVGLTPGQHEDLRLRVANDEYLERMGVMYDPLLRDLNFDVVRSGNQWLVRVRSKRTVSEPFLDFPLHLSWPGGHLIRLYTLLFDPPLRVQPARVASVRHAVAAETTATPATADKVGVDTYGPVRKGETLWPIAKQLKPRGITTRQMIMALLRANPEAFVDGNINNLRAGATLKIPLRAVIEQLDAETARVEFAEQNRRWEPPSIGTSPRALERVTDPSDEEAPQPPAQTPDAEGVGETAQATDEVTETPAQPPAPQDQLRIVNEQAAAAPDSRDDTAQEPEEKLLVTLEQTESNRLTAGAMESRLARLEAELESMQQLIELKNAQIEALGAEVAADSTAQRTAPTDKTAAVATAQGPQATATEGEAPRRTEAEAAPTPGPISVTAQVPRSTPADSGEAPWYRDYLWALWTLLGGLAAGTLALLWRRRARKPTLEGVRLADHPEIKAAKPRPYSAAAAAGSSALKKAEEDFRRLARERLGEEAIPDLSLEDLPETAATATPHAHPDDPSETLSDSGKLFLQPAGPSVPAQDFSDEEIVNWLQELHGEDEPLKLDEDEVPDILDELDDRLAASDAEPPATREPIDLPEEEQLGLERDLPDLLSELDDQLDAAETPRIALDPFDLADEALGGADDEIPTLAELEDQLAGSGQHVQPPGVGATPAAEPHEDEAFAMSLDLARAYIEIGDQDGAKDMLEQALSGARAPDHRRQIEELLQQIA